MTYQPSENCYYMGLKSVTEWKIPDNETSAEAKDRYNKLLTVNLRPNSYQRARDNNIKRRFDLMDKLKDESPMDYINSNVQAYVDGEIIIPEILVQSCTNPPRPGLAPPRCYLIGKRNIIKVRSYEKIENDIGNANALRALLILDLNLSFGFNIIENCVIADTVIEFFNRSDYFIEGIMNYWEYNIKRHKAKASNHPVVNTGVNPDNNSDMDADTDEETEELEFADGEYEYDETSTEYTNDSDIIIGDTPIDDDENYDYTNDSDVQIEETFPDASEDYDYSDLKGNLDKFL